LIQPQDATATAVGFAAGAQPGMRVLDLCAAPGTKTTHLAELMNNRGKIVAVDVSEEKLGQIESNCRRLGIDIVECRLAETVGTLEPQSFDLVLVDVPCSNTGVLSRRAEARWRFDEKKLAVLVRDQRFLAAVAAGFVRPGGRLVYSTCSIEREENEDLAAHLLDRRKRLFLLGERLTLPAGCRRPARWRDGGYVAIFQAR